MEKFYSISKAAQLLGICGKTIRRWDKKGIIKCKRTLGNHRRISQAEIDFILKVNNLTQIPSNKPVAIYCRVSSHDQKKKGDLERQIGVAKEYCFSKKLNLKYIFTDVASGLNTHRKGLKKMCSLVEQGLISTIVITYQDRLTRFGFEYLEDYFKSHGATITIINPIPNNSLEDELVQDLIEIITAFSGRVYGLRSHKNKNLIQ